MDKNIFAVDEKRQSAVDIVIDKIKELLIREQLKPGELLPNEHRLSESLGVSRGSIREAMKILSSFGIVEIRRGDGTYISSSANQRMFDPLLFGMLLSAGGHEDLIELRRILEIGIIDAIIERATDDDLELLHAQYRELECEITAGDDVETLSQCDLGFHYIMASITKNKMLENIYHFVAEMFAPTMSGDYALEPHRLIIEAISKRDKSLAENAIEKHTEVWRGLMANKSSDSQDA